DPLVTGVQTCALPISDHLSVFPATQQCRLRLFQLVVFTRVIGGDMNSVKAIPKILRAEPFGWKTPNRRQDRFPIPIGHLRLRARSEERRIGKERTCDW